MDEFIRLFEAGSLTNLDDFCARYPDELDRVKGEIERFLRSRGKDMHRDRLIPGRSLGSYEIVERIGAGAMGEVYRAKDSRLDRDVAIKVLSPELACQPERVKRFEREAKVIAALDHPHITPVARHDPRAHRTAR